MHIQQFAITDGLDVKLTRQHLRFNLMRIAFVLALMTMSELGSC